MRIGANTTLIRPVGTVAVLMSPHLPATTPAAGQHTESTPRSDE